MSWESNVRIAQPYVPGEQPNQPDMIKLNTNECPYPPAPKVTALLEAFDSNQLRLYPDPEAGILTNAIADYYKVPKEQVFVGVGSDDVLAMSFLTFFQSGNPIFFPDITYSFYEVWADLYRIPYRKIPLDETFSMKLEDYLRTGHETPCGGILFPNPNAPTGVLESVAMIEEIVKHNQDCVVIIDEAYIDFGGETCIPLLQKYDNLLVVQTFSKSRAMAGMRIGFAIGSQKLIQYLNNVKFSFNSYTMNMPSLLGGSAAIEEEEYFRETIRKIVETREWTKAELRNLGFKFPDSYGNFIFATHPTISAKKIYQGLREKQIYVRYFPKPRIDEYLRITIGTKEEMEVFIRFLKQIIE